MKWLKASVAACALAAIGVSSTAYAGHVVVGVGIGVPAYPYPYYYPVAPVPYYYPPVVAVPAVPADPPTYIEQGQVQGQAQGQPQPQPQPGPDADAQQQQQQQQQQQAGTWYYCDAAHAYYPYVKQCAGGWRAVPANPPSPDQ